MTLTIDVPPEIESALRQHADQSGQDVATVVLQAIQEKLDKARTFAEVCAPFAEAVEVSGIADEQFDRFFEEAREEVWEDKQSKSP